MAAINYTQGIDELGRWLYKQVVKCPAGNDNRARVRPLSHASLDSHSWLSVLPGKGCSRKRPSAFLGRCFDLALAANVGRTRYKLQRMTGRSGKSREIGGHPQSSLKARAAVKASRQVKAPFCRQGAATPAPTFGG
jgi:hypothetical protein